MTLREFCRPFSTLGVEPKSKKYQIKVVYQPTQETWLSDYMGSLRYTKHPEVIDMDVIFWTIEYNTIVVVVK